MAERRMFSKTIIDSDAFLDMPLSTQCLYFHLSMRADDDGFINNPKKIQRIIGCSDDDMKILCAKSFIIPFESGIVVIKHWKIHNYIRSDRYKETNYQEEKSMLSIKENGSYTLGIPNDIPMVASRVTQDRIGKDRIGKDSLDNENDSVMTNHDKEEKIITNHDEYRADKNYKYSETSVKKVTKKTYGQDQNVKLSDDEYSRLVSEYGKEKTDMAIEFLSSYKIEKGYKTKDDNRTLRRWVFDAISNKSHQTYQKGSMIQKSGCDEVVNILNAEVNPF